MRQRWLLNLALLVIAAVLAGFVFYTLEQDEQLLPLTDLKAEKVQSIRIERANKEPIFMMKDAQGFWQMATPFNLLGNQFQIERLLQILSERDYKKIEAENLNLTELQLDPPLASIRFNQVTVEFGDSSPIDYGQRYVQLNKKVYLIKDNLFYTLNDDALIFASTSPLGNAPKITTLKMPNYHLVLKEGKWTLTSTFSSDDIETGADALSTLIDNWQHALAFSVEPYKESPGQGEIEITLLGQDEPLRFVIVSTTPDFVLARPDKAVQYQFPINQVDKLLHLPTKGEESQEE